MMMGWMRRRRLMVLEARVIVVLEMREVLAWGEVILLGMRFKKILSKFVLQAMKEKLIASGKWTERFSLPHK
jgi:hypothetical protein